MEAPERPDRSLAPAELARVRTALAAARGKARLDVVLSSADPQAVVRALPADELYLMVREVGLADAAPLVPLASAAQFRAFLDLDAWVGDRVDVTRALPWIRAARAGAVTDPKAASRWAAKLKGLDAELLHLVLRGTIRVHDLEQDPDPEIESGSFVRSPDGKLLLEFLVEGAEYAAVRGLLDDLMAEDPFLATRLLSAIRWDLPSELEESALRWRTGRLADLGHPPLEEALSWFSRPPRQASVARPGAPLRPPGFLLAEVARGSLLDRAAASLPGAEREVVEGQVIAAANAVLAAERVDPGDPERVREALATARAYLELGLEKLAGGDVPAAAEVLAAAPLKRVFQEGFGRVLELGWRALRLRERAEGEEGETRLGSPLDELLAALTTSRPRYFPGVEAPREDWGTVRAAAFEARPFASSADLARAAAALDEVEARLDSPSGGQRPPGGSPTAQF